MSRKQIGALIRSFASVKETHKDKATVRIVWKEDENDDDYWDYGFMSDYPTVHRGASGQVTVSSRFKKTTDAAARSVETQLAALRQLAGSNGS